METFLSLEHSFHSKNEFLVFKDVMQEYFNIDHTELVPTTDLEKPEKDVFSLPMHAVKRNAVAQPSFEPCLTPHLNP